MTLDEFGHWPGSPLGSIECEWSISLHHCGVRSHLISHEFVKERIHLRLLNRWKGTMTMTSDLRNTHGIRDLESLIDHVTSYRVPPTALIPQPNLTSVLND